MYIDTHLHQKKHSDDSFMSLEEIVARAKVLGLDGICITDHESNGIKEEADRLAKSENFIIITGAEFLTDEGDMTVFGLDVLPASMIPARDLIERVHQVGGVAICSHPYRKNNRGMGDGIRELPRAWAVEAFNGSTPEEYNLEALAIANELNLATLGGSDAHVVKQVGCFATEMPDWVIDEKTFIKAVKMGATIPVTWTPMGYERLVDSPLFTDSIQSEWLAQSQVV